jgi:phage-related protein
VTVRELVTVLGFKLNDAPLKKYDKEIDSTKAKSNALAGAAKGIGTAYKVAAVAVGVGFAWISKNIIDATIEMEGYRSQLQAFTGDADSAAEALSALRDKTIDPLFGTGNLVNAYKQLRTLGMDADNTSKMIDVLGDVANGSAENFNALGNVLTRVATSGKVNEGTLRQLANAGFGAGDMAQGLGISVEQLQKRISAGEIGFEDLTRAMEGATREGGRFYQNAERQARTLGGSIKILKDVISSTGDAIGTAVLPKIVDTIRYITDLIKIGKEGFTNFGVKAFEGIIHAIQDVIIFFQLLQMRMRKFGGAFTPIKALIGDVFGFLKSIISSAQPLLMNLAQLFFVAFKPIQAFVRPVLEALKPIFAEVFSYLAKLVAGVIPIINGLSPVFKVLGNIVGAVVSVFANGGMTIIKALMPLAGIILAIVGAIKIWTAIQWLLNVALNANPIGLIILAIVALIGIIVLLVKNLDKVGAFFTMIGNAIVGFFKAVWNTIVGLFNKVVGFIKKNAELLLQILAVLIFGPVALVAIVIRQIIKHWDKIKPALVKVFTFVVDKIKAIWGKIVGIVRGVVDGIKAGWTAFAGFITGLWERIKNAAASIWEGIKNVFFGVVDGIKNIWNGLIGFFSGLWDALKESPTAALEFIKNAFLGLFDNIKEKFLGFINVIKNGWEKVKGFFGGIKDGVVNFVTGGGEQPRSVNDLIVTPDGQYSTHPDDYVMAMKNPGELIDSILRFLGGPQPQPAFAGGGSLVGNAMGRATSQNNYNSSSSVSNINAPINVRVDASGMTPDMASAVVKRGVEDALREAINGSRGSIPSPEARRH